LGSGVFTEVQEVPYCKAFGSCAFTAVRLSSDYLLTETLTFCIGQLIASTVSRFAFRYSIHIAEVARGPLLDFEIALLGKRWWRNQAKLMAADMMVHWLARIAWSPVGRNVVGVDSTPWLDPLALFTLLAVVEHGRIFKVRRVVVLRHRCFLSPKPNRIV
jgi:hypothetical protein